MPYTIRKPAGGATLAFALALFSTPAMAQSAAEAGKALKDRAGAALSGGTADSPTFSGLDSAFQIETSQDDTDATLAISFARSHEVGRARAAADGSRRLTFATDSFQVKATAPLGKNGKPSVFDFEKLGDDTTLKLTVSRYVGSVLHRRLADPQSTAAIAARVQDACLKKETDAWIDDADDAAKARAAATAYSAAYESAKAQRQGESQTASPSYLMEFVADKDDDTIDDLAEHLFAHCANTETMRPLVRKYGSEADIAGYDGWNAGGLWFFGASTEIGRSNYTFLVPATFMEDSSSRTSYKGQFFAGHVARTGLSSLQASFSYSRAYTEQDPVQLCQPNGMGAQQQCLSGAAGPPARTNKYIAAAEFRQLFDLAEHGSIPRVGIAPRLSYDFKRDAMLVDLPIYLASNKDRLLNGGVRFGYDTGKKDFAFGLFVGAPFSIFF